MLVVFKDWETIDVACLMLVPTFVIFFALMFTIVFHAPSVVNASLLISMVATWAIGGVVCLVHEGKYGGNHG